MRQDVMGMQIVRADLCERLDQLQRVGDRLTIRDMMQGIGTIRTLAAAYGLVPVVSLADALERAVRTEPRHCPAHLYFERLRDAIGCDARDEGASQALLASVSVRLGG